MAKEPDPHDVEPPAETERASPLPEAESVAERGRAEPRAQATLVDVDDPDGSAETVERKPLRKKRRWLRVLLWVLAVLLVLLGAGVAFVVVYADWIARVVVLSRAEAHGVKLEFETLVIERHGLTVESATMGNAKLAMSSLPGVDIEAEEVKVSLSGWSPNEAVVSKVKVKFAAAPGVKISAKSATIEIADFAPASTEVSGVTLTADDAGALVDLADATMSEPLAAVKTHVTGAHLKVKRIAPALPEELSIDAEQIERDGAKTVLVGVHTKLPIVGIELELGRLELAKDAAKLAIHVPAYPELTLEVAERGAKIDASVARVPADLLAEKLGWSRPPNFSLTASTSISISASGVSGTYKATLAHYVPPHPRELNGIVFGDGTDVSGGFKLDRTRLVLSDMSVSAGALKLKGSGTAEIANGGRAELTLDGSVGCTELAASVVGSHLGLGAAFFTGQIAQGHLTGTVSVHLGVILEGKDAAHPELHPSALLHCGLAL